MTSRAGRSEHPGVDGGLGPVRAADAISVESRIPAPPQRYARLAQIEAIGRDGLAVLQRARAAVIGVGNLGGQVAGHLATLGVAMILVDPDVVSEENLSQGFAAADVGLPKVEARARALGRLNSSSSIDCLQADVARLGGGGLRTVDLIFACPDNHRARVAVNEIATRLGIPWVDAAVDGSGASCTSRVAAFAGGEDAPCYLCAHDRESLRGLLEQNAGRPCPRWRWDAPSPASPPTVAMPAVGAAIAAAQVIWGLEILLGRGERVLGREAYLDLGLTRLTGHRLTRNPACVFDHRRFALTPLGPVGSVTVADTFAAAAPRVGSAVTLELHRGSVVAAMRCVACGAARRPHRLLEAMSQDEARCECGEVMQPLADGLLDCFDRHAAAEILDRTWGRIGLPPDDVVTAVGSTGEVHFLLAAEEGPC